ncbi:YfhJ family protein [Pseudalkalibacillus salsuginis]|uniref:YfhJ family protein n=1 Tax=Pseudalkalibacillus salsuginis TaxID=2910972 RepID=UPI001F3548B5|nr:YfhJ family protein [Pseudalkalibacillus salsuginis]MCF6411992.1 YfhJ family protein [Pseudalkalibacillus salsuginis]
MEEIFHDLAEQLRRKNPHLTYEEARSWVEALWEDFESTRARAGRSYEGQQVTERIVREWITRFGGKLHEYFSANPKFQHLLKKSPKH